MRHTAIYEKMVDSGMNDIVGGGDPVVIGEQNVAIIERFVDVKPGMKVLDFGCGCGRVALPLLDKIGETGKVVGVDIIPEMIEFCRNEISSAHQNTDFYQLVADNSHYTQWTEDQAGNSSQISDLPELQDSDFDLIFAFSVFTHLDLADTKKYLSQLRKLLRPGGHLVVSVMFINESSRKGQRLKIANVPYNRSVFRNKQIYFGNNQDKLAAVGFSEASFIDLATSAGFEVSHIYYGSWSGRPDRACGQDVIALTAAPDLPNDFDAKRYIEMYDDLPWDSNTSEGLAQAKKHYLLHGFYEGREWR